MNTAPEQDTRTLPKPPWVKLIMSVALFAAVVAFRRAHVRKVH